MKTSSVAVISTRGSENGHFFTCSEPHNLLCIGHFEVESTQATDIDTISINWKYQAHRASASRDILSQRCVLHVWRKMHFKKNFGWKFTLPRSMSVLRIPEQAFLVQHERLACGLSWDADSQSASGIQSQVLKAQGSRQLKYKFNSRGVLFLCYLAIKSLVVNCST